jgi:general secretion pathway protein D
MKRIGIARAAAASLFAFAIAASALADGGVESRMFDLRYADAAEVAANLNRTWRGGSVLTNGNWSVGEIAVPFAEANSVMVTASGEILDSCAKMVERIDRKPRQVYIEARFVELSNTAMFNLGLDWSAFSDFGVYGGVGGSISKQRIPDNITKYSQDYKTRSSGASESYEFSRGGMADNSYFYGTLSTDQMRLVLMAFQGSEDFKTFSNPKVIVTSGKEAVVDMTTKRPNVTLSAKRVLNGSNNTLDVDSRMTEIPGRDNLMFAHEAFFSWGVTLSVLPRVMTNGLINVSIVPTISSLKDYVRAESSESDEIPAPEFPIIDIQRIVTEFTLKDGQTAVIGGLSRTIEKDIDGGIPYLSDIPWIGDKLFGGKTRAKEQREIIVFVTVGLSDPANVAADAGLPKNAVLGRTYTNGTRLEPGDRKNAVEGIQSLDLRALEDRASETRRE